LNAIRVDLTDEDELMENRNFVLAQKLAKEYCKKLRKEGAISITQMGSSLRKDKFIDNSDLDLLVVYEKPVKKNIKIEYNEIEVNILRRGKNQLVKLLIEGNPVDLIALKFGKVLFDKGTLKNLRNKNFKPTKQTIKKWMHTASFNLMSASHNYSLPACICCYFKSLHHAARDFSRAIILKEKGELIDGDKHIIKELKFLCPDLIEKYGLILEGRKNFEKFEQKCVETVYIKRNELGRYLLAAEDFARRAFGIALNMKLPKVNKLISYLKEKYEIYHFHGFSLSPERKELLIGLILKDDEVKISQYDLEKERFI